MFFINMKKIVLFFALTCAGSTVFADSRSELTQNFCKVMESVADTSQFGRQYGKKPSEVLDSLLKAVDNYQLNDAVKVVVQIAFEEPIRENEVLKKKAISEFSGKIYFQCVNLDKK